MYTDQILLALVAMLVGCVLARLLIRHLFRGLPEPFKNCGGCRYYDKGACRRYPPARVYTGDQSKEPGALDVTVWPIVLIDNWCGEWRDRP